VQWGLQLLVEELHLVVMSLDIPLHRGLFEGVHWEVVVLDLVAILAARPPPGRGAGVREGAGGIAPQLGHEGQVALLGHVYGVVVAKVASEDEGGQRAKPRDQVQQGVYHGVDPYEFRGERDGRLGFVRTALRAPWTTCGAWRCGVVYPSTADNSIGPKTW